MSKGNIYIQDYSRIFTVRKAFDIGQPFVCGEFTEVVKYALEPSNGIEYFAEISNMGFHKLSRKRVYSMLEAQGSNDLLEKLKSKY